MTKRRMATLLSGVVFLGAISWWRLDPSEVTVETSRSPGGGAIISKSTSTSGLSSFGGQTMGTSYTVKCVLPLNVELSIARSAVDEALQKVNRDMSTYVPTSEVSRFNGQKGLVPTQLSEDLMSVLRLSQRVHEQTRGAFDVTVRPLVAAFGFGSAAQVVEPSEQTLLSLRKSVGMHLLKLDFDAGTAQKLSPDVQIDLGAVAKGFGVDQAAAALESLATEQYMVEVGGEIRVRGEKSPGAPWTLGIEEPTPDKRRLHGTLTLSARGGALATSGDYRNFRVAGEQTFSHTLDPRTGRPTPRRTALVSVVRPTAAEADALATGLGVLAPEEAISLSNEHGWAVYLLTHQRGGGFASSSSAAFEALEFRLVAEH